MNDLDARIATLSLAMEFALRRDAPEMFEFYAEQHDELVEQKITSDGPPPEGYDHG